MFKISFQDKKVECKLIFFFKQKIMNILKSIIP